MSSNTIPAEDDDYRCAHCGEVYEQARPQSEVIVEFLEAFPDADLDDFEIVCDDCYQLLTGAVRGH